MAKPSRGFMPKCPIFKPVGDRQSECLAERDNMRFVVTRYKNGNLVAWRVPNRGHAIRGRRLPISTPTGIKSIKHLLDEATRYVRRHDRPRA